MNIQLRKAALLAPLFFAWSSQAQDAAAVQPDAATPPPPRAAASAPAPGDAFKKTIDELKNSALWQAYMATATELAPVLGNDDVKARVAQLEGFEFSEQTRKRLLDLFGNEAPLHVKSKALPNGDALISIVVDALSHQDAQSGSRLAVAALKVSSRFSQGYTKEQSSASLQSIRFEDGKTTEVTASDFSYATDTKKGYSGLWFGTGVARMEHFSVVDSARSFQLKIDGVSIKSQIKPRGDLIDLSSDSVVKSIHWGKDGVGPVHIGFRVSNLDGKALAALTQRAKELNQGTLDEAQRTALSTGMLKDFGLATLKQGGAIDLQDISVQYHGKTASISGRVAFDNVLESDLEKPELLTAKLASRVRVRIPMAMVTDIARTVARSTLQAQDKSGQPVTERVVAATANAIVEKLIEKPLQQKWIRIERNTLVSDVEFKAGKLTINGQAVALPAPKQP